MPAETQSTTSQAPAESIQAPQPSIQSSSAMAYQPSSSPASAPADTSFKGMTWSIYTTPGGPAKTQEQANADFVKMADFNVVRIYGVDSDQTNIAIKAAKLTGKKIFAGIFDLGSAASDANVIVEANTANGGDWSIFETISVGNEDVGNKGASVASVRDAMNAATPVLRAAGYNGPIVHVDTVAAFINPATSDLCNADTAGDYIAANIHPFFDPNTDAANAGPFVQNQIQMLAACASQARRKRGTTHIRVTETGWPKQGEANGKAVPSEQNQITAVDSIKSSVTSEVVMFSAFNAEWQAPGYLGVEPFWGILDNPLYQ